ncbi:MAG: uridine phosphorylase [Candidatus Bathyarchaeota archaeon]|nr:uridine phosphorylase [Candidatus Bathyarchaeota archaeon]
MKKRSLSAVRPETEERVQYHINLKPGDVSRYVLLPGDPDRVPKITKNWDKVREVAKHREYLTHTGFYKGVRVSACSTGIGSPAAAVAVEELANVGADTFIRVGSTGSIREECECGDLIISTGAVRLEGTSKEYVRVEYPAVASYDVVAALIEAAESFGYRYHVGITASTDSFYCGQARSGFGGYKQSWMEDLIPDLRAANVHNLEMEAAAILTLANLFGLRAGAVCAVFANRITDEFKVVGEEEAGKTATEAVKTLYEWDEAREKNGKKYWFPTLVYGR